MANAVSKLEANAQLTLHYLKYSSLIVNLKKTKFMLAGRKQRDEGISMARFALCNEELQPKVITNLIKTCFLKQCAFSH